MRCHAAFWAFVQQHGTAHAVTIATHRDEDVAKTTKWLLNRQGKQLRNLWLALSPAERQELMEATPDPSFPTTENGIYDERQDRKIRYFQELHSAQQAASSATSAESRIDNSAPAETSLISSAASTSEEVQSSRHPPRTRSRGAGHNEAEQVTDDMSAELSVAEDLSSGETSAQEPRPKRRKTLVTRSKKTPDQATRQGRQLLVPSIRVRGGQQMVSELPTARRSRSQREELTRASTTHELSQQPEVTGYEMALSARGWRAQLLKDVDLHLLRAVAEIAGCLESTEGLNSGEAVGIDLTQALRELETAAGRVQAAQRRLSSLVAATIAQAESLSGVEGANSLHGINSPWFVSTGQGSLVLMSDIERYLLMMSEAVRRYRRAIGQCGLSTALDGQADDSADLWPLQLHIEGLMAELKELSASIYAQAKHQLAGT